MGVCCEASQDTRRMPSQTNSTQGRTPLSQSKKEKASEVQIAVNQVKISEQDGAQLR